MLKVYDYKCPQCGAHQERFVDSAFVDEQVCNKCVTTMKRVVSCPSIYLDGTDPDFPGAWSKWERDKERRVRMAKDKQARNGDTTGIRQV